MAYITNVSALDKTPPVSPMVLLDCGITANNPVKSGTTVVGKDPFPAQVRIQA